MSIIKAACIQLNSGLDIEENLRSAERYIREAAGQGATLIVTPENTCQLSRPGNIEIKDLFAEDDHPGIPLFSGLARELGVWLSIGSLSIKLSDTKKANRSYLFSDQGEITGTYDKIHMFDVNLKSGETHKESDTVQAGDKAVVADMGFAKLGLSICYDLRFSHLYRDLAKAGAEILTIPAAFTVPTGQAHWEILLRTRAIETGSFVLAAGQTGTHGGGLKTWGHSMIIGPWGEVLAAAEEQPGVIVADIDLDEVEKCRRAIPALEHDLPYTVVS